MTRIPVILILLGALIPLPLSAQPAPAGPVITSIEAFFPKLDSAPIPNSFSYPYQTALKDGDETYLTSRVADEFPIVQATVDLSSLGMSQPVRMTEVGTGTAMARLLQSDSFTIATNGKNGTFQVPVTVTDANGQSATQTLAIAIDNRPPVLSISKFVALASTTLRQLDLLSLSGLLDGTGTLGRLFRIFLQITDIHGNAVSGGTEYYGLQEAAALRSLPGALFSNITFPIFEETAALAHAAALKLSLLGKDEAGNVGTTTALLLLGTSTPPTSTSTPPQQPGISIGSSILFLPGIEASRLYIPQNAACTPRTTFCLEHRVWEPHGNGDVEELALDADGKSMRADVYVKPGDIITTARDERFRLSKDLYASFFASLSKLQSDDLISDWESVAYDWRLSLDDLLTRGAIKNGKIFYGDATSTPYIEQTLRGLAATSNTGKVTIIAHSNGGLIAKALLQKLGASQAAELVDRVILVAVPQSGAAMAIGTLLYGYGGALPFDYCAEIPLIGQLCSGLVNRAAARAFAEHAPLAYHLLPSAAYFKSVTDGRHHVVEFNATHAFEAERAVYKSAINSLSELYNFMQATEGGRTKPSTEDTRHANVLSDDQLLGYASTTHAALDAWTPPSSIEVVQIAGIGNGTLSGIDYDDYSFPIGAGNIHAFHRPIITHEGDGTVAAQSEVQMKAAANIHSYWLQLNKIGTGLFGKYDHGDILEAPELQALIGGILRGTSLPLTNFLTERPPTSNFSKRLLFVLHSPLTLEVYDAQNRHVGSTPNGLFEQAIPDADYGELGEVKYISVPEGNAYKIVLRGLASGTFTFDVQEMSGDAVTRTTSFADIPSTDRTLSFVTVSGSPVSISSFQTDVDGDGTFESILTPRAGAVVHYATPVPPKSAAPEKEGKKPVLPAPKKETATTSPTTTASTTVESPSLEFLPELPAVSSASSSSSGTPVQPDIADSDIGNSVPHSIVPKESQRVSALISMSQPIFHQIIEWFYKIMKRVFHYFS